MTGIGMKLRLGLLTVAFGVLSACSAQYRSHGYVPLEGDLQQIVVGVDTRASVEDLIGVPTISGVSGDGGYYYIESNVRHFAYRAPEEVSREILAISFDAGGVVSNIERYGLEDGIVVPISRRVTETGAGDISFIRKLFGNIGGVSAEDLLGASR
ncbi:outer membrane protein assembly factor BamE [Puniceibacterium sediminis]|uniref:Beta-barrel assembly machine subunit BamE n=1 Tax=Puniceibacterium sediminis TaxID=1608407 RepID=A0A238XKY5_9RHOB|nr:outer membrane protein assembly factor BamE [Puniceibacterium sediminis]SNR58984.1 Beta-barrel assembly machine subunit BamE [Puniceibacterium sediminis]